MIASMGTKRTQWDGCEGEFVLLANVVHLACKDALQTRNERLSEEAWDFLDKFAPDIAQRLRLAQHEKEGERL